MAGWFVLHVPFSAGDEPEGWRLARIAVHMVGMLPGVETAAASVSRRDDQRLQFRLFCGRILGGGRRCLLPVGHTTSCASAAPPPAFLPESVSLSEVSGSLSGPGSGPEVVW